MFLFTAQQLISALGKSKSPDTIYKYILSTLYKLFSDSHFIHTKVRKLFLVTSSSAVILHNLILDNNKFDTHLLYFNTLRTGLLNCLNARSWGLIQSEVRFL